MDYGTMKKGVYRKANVRVIMEVFITHMGPKENRHARNGKVKVTQPYVYIKDY